MIESRYLMAKISAGQKQRQSSFGFLMQVIARRIDATMKEELAKIDVDVKLFANLMVLSDRDGITQKELGHLLEFPDYFTSRNVDALIDAGLAERRPDPNSRRSVLVFLTDKGRKKATELPRVIQKVNSQFLEPLKSSEKKAIIQLLHKVGGIPEGGDPNL
ncbi:transcriptional regulator, MarR family [Parasphingorhabdus marina DSM 22363]|uniref:Transcriptional regulator, MarR family n=1 Tax=Parasphingorhabdus marina DSM 22363 TaxID=1123272 RepID=A0A1N6H891_9SPHN|nr:MarR family transcriptional regulator [Parasphingorhabdus marina]SIO15950.1 transcriptional regulator, MarR family [Parasphingorhabdus marina DSM 22363]